MINDAVERLAAGLLRGRPTEFAGLRKQQVEEHVVYYLDEQQVITVVRILHGRMDAKRHLPR